MLAEEILLSITKWTVSGSRSWKRTTLPFFSGYLQSSLGFDMFLSNSGCSIYLRSLLTDIPSAGRGTAAVWAIVRIHTNWA